MKKEERNTLDAENISFFTVTHHTVSQYLLRYTHRVKKKTEVFGKSHQKYSFKRHWFLCCGKIRLIHLDYIVLSNGFCQRENL